MTHYEVENNGTYEVVDKIASIRPGLQILHDLTKKHYGEEFHEVRWSLVSEDDTVQAKDLEEESMRFKL